MSEAKQTAGFIAYSVLLLAASAGATKACDHDHQRQAFEEAGATLQCASVGKHEVCAMMCPKVQP